MLKNPKQKVKIMGKEKNPRKDLETVKKCQEEITRQKCRYLKVKRKKNLWMELTTGWTQQKKVLMDPKTSYNLKHTEEKRT